MKAQGLLTEVVTALEDEAALEELRASAQTQLAEVNKQISLQDAIAAAKAKYAQFVNHVDQARFYSSLVLGDSIARDTAIARDHINKAVALYQLDADKPLDELPEHLSKEEIGNIRQNGYELFISMAETEVTLASAAGEENLEPAATRALEWLEKASRIGDPSRALLQRQARYYKLAGNNVAGDKAEVEAAQVLPTTSLDFYLLAEEQRSRKQYAEAIKLYHRALIVDPNDFWALNQQGVAHILNNRFSAAAAVFTACIGKRPESAICYCLRGVALSALGQADEAMDDFNRAAERDPDLYAIYQNRGTVHFTAQRFDDAISDFEQAIALAPKSGAPHRNLGEIYRRQDQLPKALVAFNKAIELEPLNGRGYRLRGTAYLFLDEPEKAREDFAKSSKLDRSVSNVTECWKDIGLTYMRDEKWEDALKWYDDALSVDPEYADVHRLRAEVLLSLQRDKEAIEAFNRYFEAGGKIVGDVYRARGLAAKKSGDLRRAVSD